MPQTVDVAVGGLIDLYFVEETTFGSTPVSTTWSHIRALRAPLNLKKDATQSEERSRSRQRKHHVHSMRSTDGQISAELSSRSYDEFFQAVLGGTWAASGSVQVAGTVVVTTAGLTVAASAFIDAGFKVGDVFTLKAAGLAQARYQAASVGHTNIDVRNASLPATTVVSATIAVVGHKLRIGNNYRSYSVLRHFADKNLYQNFKGLRFNGFDLTIPATGLLSVGFTPMGTDADAMSSTNIASALSSALTTTPMVAVNGSLFEGSDTTEIGIVTGLRFNMTNNMDRTTVVGRNTSPHILFGRFGEITGELTVLFDNVTMYNKFVNETESALDFVVYDSNSDQTGNFLRFRMGRIKYNGGDIDDGADTAVPITLPFVALEPTGTVAGEELSALVMQRSNTS